MHRLVKWLLIALLALVLFAFANLLVFGVGTDVPGDIGDIVTSP